VVTGVFITALYTFRMFIMTFLGKERMDHHTQEHLHESPWVVTFPLIALAIPSAVIGWFTVKPMLYGKFFEGAIYVAPANNVLEHLGEEFHSSASFMMSAFLAPPIWLAGLGVLTAYVFYLWRPTWPDMVQARFKWLYTILVDKFGFDWFNEHVIMAGARLLGGGLWRFGDQAVIDDGLVNGSARTVGWLGSVMRYAQSGYLYHYAFAMILGLAALLMWLIWR
jgi:NADH-quinone oxidoreductase subunit L